MKTNIEYTDQVSNPLMARPVGDESVKIGTFCEKPDADGTCKNCWAEVINLRWGNGLAFDKANRDKIEWIKREKEMNRLLMLNKQKPISKRNPGNPLMVFCCDTFDIFQPSITDELRDWVFDNYDQCSNLTLQIQTTYPAKMKNYFAKRYGEADLPSHYWIGMSAGNQPFLEANIQYLLAVAASVHYVIFEPLLAKVNPRNINLRDGGVLDALRGIDKQFQCHFVAALQWIIVGGESGNDPRPCAIEWIREIVSQCKLTSVPVLVKQLGARPEWTKEFAHPNSNGEIVPHTRPFPIKHRKGGDINEFPEDLKIREFPEVTR